MDQISTFKAVTNNASHNLVTRYITVPLGVLLVCQVYIAPARTEY